MTWLAVMLGVALTTFDAIAGAALITVSRAELTRAVGRRLRGGPASLTGLAQIDYYLTAASATTSLGVLLLGAAVPGLLAGSSAPRFVVGVALLAVPLVLFAAYLVPRWLTQPRAETVAERVIPSCARGPGCWDSCSPRALLPVPPISARSGARVLPSAWKMMTS